MNASILVFVNRDYIIIGDSLSFGGRTSVILVILIEIVDAFVDKKKRITLIDYKNTIIRWKNG